MKVLLFACIEKNIGDDLFVRTICRRYPHVDFYITSRASYLQVNDIPNLHYDDRITKYLRFADVNSNSKPKQLLANGLATMYSLGVGKYDIGVYIVGNAFKNMHYTGEDQIKWLDARTRLARKFYLVGTNFGPFIDHEWVTDCQKRFSQMADVCFRDRKSYDWFSDLSNVRYAPDAVLSMGYQQGNDHKEKKLIISLIDCSFRVRENWLRELTDIYEQKLVEIAEGYLSAGYEVVLLNSNELQDKPASERIASKLSNDKLSIVNYNGDMRVVEQLYREASCVIGTRLHTIILGWLYRVPVFPIVYDTKVEEMLASYQYKGDSVHIKNIADLSMERVCSALANNTEQINPQIVQDAQQQFVKLDEVLRNE